MREKILHLIARIPQIEEALGGPLVLNDKQKYRELAQEHAYLSDIKNLWDNIESCENNLDDAKEMRKEADDEELAKELEEEVVSLENHLEKLTKKMEDLLIPPDPRDHSNTILELRAGTGGEEAALFVADCVRMYKLFADSKGWKYEHLSSTQSESGGYREYVMVLSGKNVYRKLRYEGGTHRVQRVPETEAQGRVHTSAITIAVLLEPDEEEDITLDEKDLRFDTYRASGAGGQHVNTTDSAVRVTHIPSGLVSYCSEEKSQHKNKAKALRLLKAKIVEEERRKHQQEVADSRAKQVGSGDRSERIRTYNFPQNRITDHRINYTKYNLDRCMDGDLDEVINALVAHFHQQQLRDLN